jgi:hypothetical protein
MVTAPGIIAKRFHYYASVLRHAGNFLSISIALGSKWMALCRLVLRHAIKSQIKPRKAFRIVKMVRQEVQVQ